MCYFRIALLSVLGVFFSSIAPGQDMLGLTAGNYAGTSSISMNPAYMPSSRYYLDFNLLEVHSYFGNNYHYIHGHDLNLLNLLSGGPYPSYGESNAFTDIYRNKADKRGYAGWTIRGPAGMMVYGEHAFGFQINFRNHSSFGNLPYDIANFLYEALDYYPQHDILYSHKDPSQAASLTWMEIGLSYAMNFHRNKWEYWSAGITLKPLLGISGLYGNLNHVDYYVDNDSLVFVDNLNMEYGYSLPLDYKTNAIYQGPFIRGAGIGFDIGMMYQKTERGHSTRVVTRLCDQQFEDYRYRFGLSLLDVGVISFTKRAEKRVFNDASTVWIKRHDTLPEGSIDEINDKLDAYFSDYSGQSVKDDRFSMMLPPALSFQADYAVRNDLYLSGMFIWGFNPGKSFLNRPTVIAITPRYETPETGFALPVSVASSRWNALRLGFYFRYYNVYIGSDKIGSILGLSDFSGADLYFGIKLNLSRNLNMNYLKGNCGNRNYFNIETFDYRNF